MKVLPQVAGYAILASTCLARCPGEWHTARSVGACTQIPYEFLRKVLARLESSGLLRSKRGYRGGYQLARGPHEIRLAEIVVAVEPAALEPRCFFGLTKCSDDKACAAHRFWKDAREEMLGFLERSTLHDVARFEWSRDLLNMARIVTPREVAAAGDRAGIMEKGHGP